MRLNGAGRIELPPGKEGSKQILASKLRPLF